MTEREQKTSRRVFTNISTNYFNAFKFNVNELRKKASVKFKALAKRFL